MRRVLLVAALLATTAGLAFTAPQSAHASTYLQCNGFHQLRGKAGSNPPVSATVARQDDGRWSVVYVLSNGRTVIRENQYDIADKGNGVGWTGWRGGKQMHASIEHYNGRLIYAEAIYSGGNKLLGSNYIDCGPASAEPDYTPPVQTAATPYTINGKPWTPDVDTSPATPVAVTASPAPVSAPQAADVKDAVPFVYDDDQALITVTIGGRGVSMLLDTGANTGQIPEEMANELIASGHATEAPGFMSKIANGTSAHVRSVIIDSVVVGTHVVSNVEMGVGPMRLLGMNVLSHIRDGKFTIDTKNSQLVFG